MTVTDAKEKTEVNDKTAEISGSLEEQVERLVTGSRLCKSFVGCFYYLPVVQITTLTLMYNSRKLGGVQNVNNTMIIGKQICSKKRNRRNYGRRQNSVSRKET